MAFEQIVGTLEVTVVEGKSLAIRDKSGTSDPYVEVRFGRVKYRTKVITKTLNPKWNETFTFHIYSHELVKDLCIRVFDKDRFFRHDSLGKYDVDILELDEGVVEHDIFEDLKDIETGKIHLRIKYVNFKKEMTDPDSDLNSTGYDEASKKSLIFLNNLLPPLKLNNVNIKWNDIISNIPAYHSLSHLLSFKKQLISEPFLDHLKNLVNSENYADIKLTFHKNPTDSSSSQPSIFAHRILISARSSRFIAIIKKYEPKKEIRVAADMNFFKSFGNNHAFDLHSSSRIDEAPLQNIIDAKLEEQKNKLKTATRNNSSKKNRKSKKIEQKKKKKNSQIVDDANKIIEIPMGLEGFNYEEIYILLEFLYSGHVSEETMRKLFAPEVSHIYSKIVKQDLFKQKHPDKISKVTKKLQDMFPNLQQATTVQQESLQDLIAAHQGDFGLIVQDVQASPALYFDPNLNLPPSSKNDNESDDEEEDDEEDDEEEKDNSRSKGKEKDLSDSSTLSTATLIQQEIDKLKTQKEEWEKKKTVTLQTINSRFTRLADLLLDSDTKEPLYSKLGKNSISKPSSSNKPSSISPVNLQPTLRGILRRPSSVSTSSFPSPSSGGDAIRKDKLRRSIKDQFLMMVNASLWSAHDWISNDEEKEIEKDLMVLETKQKFGASLHWDFHQFNEMWKKFLAEENDDDAEVGKNISALLSTTAGAAGSAASSLQPKSGPRVKQSEQEQERYELSVQSEETFTDLKKRWILFRQPKSSGSSNSGFNEIMKFKNIIIKTLSKQFAKMNGSLRYHDSKIVIEEPIESENENENIQDGKVKKIEVPVHYVFLDWCPYFRGMISHELREMLENKIELKIVDSKKILDLLLEFLYSGKIDSIASEYVIELYKLSDNLLLTDLMQVTEFLCECVNFGILESENWIWFYHYWNVLGNKRMRDFVQKLIVENKKILLKEAKKNVDVKLALDFILGPQKS